MGLLDRFTNMSPDQSQGLLSAASQILQASGDPRRSFGFGQAAGLGIEAYQQHNELAKRRKMQEEEAAQLQEMRQMQIGGLRQEQESAQASRQKETAIRDAYSSSILSPELQAAQLPGGPTNHNAAQIGNMPGGLDQNRLIAQLMKIDPMYALKAQKELNPDVEYDTTERIGVDETTGKPVKYLLSKTGKRLNIDGVAPRDELKLMNLGGTEEAYNPYELRPGQQFKRTQTPDSIASNAVTMRGQNLVSDRALEANAIAARTGAITGATGLRKEFDDLPEVKSYKKALPAFNAIKDAAGRNTTQADINIVYGLAKLYDPDSVVREGEYATVANSPNIPEKIKGWASYLAGGGRLTPAVKAEILAEAQGRIGSYESEYSKARTGFGGVASRTGIDPSLVLPTEFKPAAAPKPSPQANGKRPPMKGQVVEGHRFKGGNPADESSWEKVR